MARLDKHTLDNLPIARFPGPGGSSVALQVLHEESGESHNAKIYLTQDRLAAFLEYERLDPEEQLTTEKLRKLLEYGGLSHGLDADCLEFAVRLVDSGVTHVGPLEVASGTAPENGINGRLDFKVKPTSQEQRYQSDDKGNVDFRKTNLFENALAGSVIATLVPPTAGTPGSTVCGEPIPSRPGEPISLRLGANVTRDETSSKFFAAIDGRILYEEGLLSITDTYAVEGDVDFSVGDIDFVGEVTITGQVLDDFSIRAKKRLEIGGVAGAARLESEGDITITGGMAGKSKGEVASRKGSVRSRYLNDVHVRASKNIVITNEIINCEAACKGRLHIPEGSIIGGNVMAGKGVVAKVIGSDMGVATQVAAGVNPEFEAKCQEYETRLERMGACITRLGDIISPLMAAKDKLAVLSAERRQTLKEMVERIKEMRHKEATIRAERDQFLQDISKEVVCQVNVLSMVYAGVVVRLGNIIGQIRQSAKGPLSIVPDVELNTIKITELHDLPPAEGLEQSKKHKHGGA